MFVSQSLYTKLSQNTHPKPWVCNFGMYTMTNKAQILLDSEHTWGRGFTLLEGTWDGDPALALWLGDMGLYFSGACPHYLLGETRITECEPV